MSDDRIIPTGIKQIDDKLLLSRPQCMHIFCVHIYFFIYPYARTRVLLPCLWLRPKALDS